MSSVFVCGGTGFIGSALVQRLVRAGRRVSVLCRNGDSRQAARALGAEPVAGDLLEPGPWQATAVASDEVVHLAQPQTFGGRVTQRRAERYRRDRLRMDRLLLDPLRPERVKKIVYVAGTSYYGNLGTEPRDEETPPSPRGWGPYIAPAIEALAGDLARGLPIVTAFPGYVYGDGSWFREYVLEPLRAGKRLTALGGRSRFASPIHVGDCARAIEHLLVAGERGRRYFLVDDRPVQMVELYRSAAARLAVPLKIRRVPPLIARLLLGPVVTDSVQSDCVLSNARLKALGFAFEFPTIEEGIADVVARARP